MRLMRSDDLDTDPASPARLRLALAGVPLVHRPGSGPLSLGVRDAALLAWLALEGPTPRARLAQLLWPESEPEAARNALRQRLFQLKKQIGVDVVSGSATLALAEGVGHDLHESDKVLGEGSHDFGPELSAWLGQQRERRRQRLRQSLVELCDMAAQAHDHADALSHAHELLALEPLSEEAHRRVMRLHYLAGDRAAALLAFDRCEQLLKNEVGARPGEETLALLRQIDSDDLSSRHPVMREVPPTVLRPPRLVGRDVEWARLASSWAEGGVSLIGAEGGMGKSRLLSDFAAAQGVAEGRVLLVGARPGDAMLPYLLLSRCLRGLLARPGMVLPAGVRGEIARLLPELGEAAAPAPGADSTRFLNAVEAVLRLAAASGLEGLLVDDLHLADDASTELLLQLCADRGLRWLIAFRDAEMRGSARAFVDELTRSRQASALALAPLSVDQVRELLGSLAVPGWDADAQAMPLHRRTGGNPMYLLETVKAMLCGAVAGGPAQAALPAVPNVSQMILRRLNGLTGQAVKLARCAAVAGQDFSAALASSVLNVPALDLADTWNELEAAQMLRDGAFAHDLIYEAALASVPAPIARELHLQIARFLESRGGEAARIAAHWVAGGEPLCAVPHLRTAARLAGQRFRYVEAAQSHEAAARILERAGDRHAAFDAYFAAADAIGSLGAGERMQSYVTKLLALADGDAEVAQAAVAQVAIDTEAGRLDEAMARAQQGLAPARRAGANEAESELLYVIGVIHWERRSIAEAVAHVERALELRRSLPPEGRHIDHMATLITVTQAFGAMLGAAGRFSESMALTGEAYRLAVDAGQPHLMLGSAAQLCHQAIEQGDLARAAEWGERGLQAAAAGESNEGDLARLLMAQALVAMLAGRWGAALDQYDQLVERYATPPNRRSADILIRRSVFHHLVGRRDLALKALNDEASMELATPVLHLTRDVNLCVMGERFDAAALLERVAGLEDVGLRARLLVRLAPRCEPATALPVLSIAASSARDAGQHGLSLSLQSRCAALLAADQRHDEAAAMARQAWLRSESGHTPSHPFAEMAADLCSALVVRDPQLAQRIHQRSEAWLLAAGSTLAPPWRDNCLARNPLREVMAQAIVRLGSADA